MSDRLVLFNKSNNTYVVFAKDFGNGYGLGNVDILKLFLEESFSFNEIVIGDLDILTPSAEDINKDNQWKYYPPEKDIAYKGEIKRINECIKNNRPNEM